MKYEPLKHGPGAIIAVSTRPEHVGIHPTTRQRGNLRFGAAPADVRIILATDEEIRVKQQSGAYVVNEPLAREIFEDPELVIAIKQQADGAAIDAATMDSTRGDRRGR